MCRKPGKIYFAFGAWWVLISDPDMHPQEEGIQWKIDLGFSESIKDWFESKNQFFFNPALKTNQQVFGERDVPF